MVDPKIENQDSFVLNQKYNDEDVQDLGREEYYEDHSGASQKKNFTPFIFGGVGLVVIVILFIIFLTGPKDTVGSKQLQSLEERIQQLEKKLTSAISMDQTQDQLGKQEQKVNSISERLDRFNSTLSTQIDQIIKELSALHQKSSQTPSAEAQQTPPPAEAAQTPAQTAQKETEPKFHQVRPKETLWGISRQYGLTVDQLRSYNKIGPKGTIQPGQQLKLTPN